MRVSIALAVVLLAACTDSARLLDAAVDLPLPAEDTAVPERIDVAAVDVAAVDVGADAGVGAVGATVDPGGVTFRVWAPGATSAAVTGDVGDHPLVAEGGGVFAARVEGAHAGQRYRFTLQRGAQSLTRLDPRARATADGSSVVVDPGAYAWRTTTLAPRARREAVIYELHVGSFAPQPGARNGAFADVIPHLDALADLRGQRARAAARERVRRRGLGLQPEAVVRRQRGVRLAGRPAAARRRGPRARHRGAARRRLQPLRRRARGAAAVLRRRLRRRRGGCVLLHRRPLPQHPVGGRGRTSPARRSRTASSTALRRG